LDVLLVGAYFVVRRPNSSVSPMCAALKWRK
jgi:hypothetical protein